MQTSRGRPRVWWVEDEPTEPIPHQTITVHENEPDDWSGLYDASGKKLYRARQPFGFRRA